MYWITRDKQKTLHGKCVKLHEEQKMQENVAEKNTWVG